MNFQRARRPEQVEARRSAILETARAMLAEQPVTDISLRELSDRVGLAKSNVLRYFDSREAIFLEVLDRAWTEWLDELADRLATEPADSRAEPYARETWVATSIADSLLSRPLLCDLVSQMAGVLEKNITLESARAFKQNVARYSIRLSDLIRDRLPHLDAESAQHFANAVHVITAGVWPFATPTENCATAMRELGMPPADQLVSAGLREGLVNQLVGLSVRVSVR